MTGTASRPKRSRRARGSLLAEDLVSAAIGLIEEIGLEAMTMPSLAKAMDAPVTSIYWHFRTKDDLITAVAEQVTAALYDALPPIDPGGAWEDEFFAYFSGLRRSMLEHRAFLDLFATRSRALWAGRTIGMLISERIEAALALLVEAGWDARSAVEMYTACSTYVRGFAMIEVFAQREEVSTEITAVADARTQTLDAERFPNLTSIGVHSEAMRYDDQQFETGLRLLIAGIGARRP